MTDTTSSTPSEQFAKSSPDAAGSGGEACAFVDCPPGLFQWKDILCFKSEYSSKPGQQDAYCVSSGEYFWGGTGGDLAARRALIVAPLPDATQTREAEGPRLMSDEAKIGERVLVHFTGKGWLTVKWEDPHGDGSYSIWTVDDDKHGPYALRGYREGDDTHWMPLPEAPRAALNGRGGA